MRPSDNAFAAVCYLVLMDHHGQGYKEAHPSYIEEKLPMLADSPAGAFSRLDSLNQARVIRYMQDWGFRLPDGIEDPTAV